MKKPQCKDTGAKPFCQAFCRQYLLSPKLLFDKKCYKAQNLIQRRQILLKLTLSHPQIRGKDVLSTAYNRRCLPAGRHRF